MICCGSLVAYKKHNLKTTLVVSSFVRVQQSPLHQMIMGAFVYAIVRSERLEGAISGSFFMSDLRTIAFTGLPAL